MGKKARPSARMRRAAETNDAVERIIACTNRLWADLSPKRIAHAQDNVRRLRRGEAAWWPPAMKDQLGDQLVTLTDHVARHAVVDLWRQQGRVAYDINPEMAAQLYRADLTGKLPGGLFRRLPHISPLVPLPRPWPFRSINGTTGLIRAYFLTGLVGREGFCATTDKRSVGLGIMPWIEWEGAGADSYTDVATPLFVLPSTDDPLTMHDILDHTGTWHDARAVDGEMKMARRILPGFMRVMTYLCCDNRDMEEPPPPPPARDPFYVRVGWHVGPALHASRMRAQQEMTTYGEGLLDAHPTLTEGESGG